MPVEDSSSRRWSLEGARALLDEVRDRTGRAAASLETVLAERESLPEGSP